MPPRSEGKKRRNSNQDDSGRNKKSIKTEPKPKSIKNEPKSTPTPKATPQPEDELIIALDFGTTFSGIAYSFKGQQHPKVVAITNWPGNPSKSIQVGVTTSLTHYCRC